MFVTSLVLLLFRFIPTKETTMRPPKAFHTVMSAAALLALAAGMPHSAHAQTAPPAPLAPVPAPLSTSASDALLAIPMPAGATVQVEMDVHDDDLLGVYKSFLKGIGQAMQAMPVYPETAARTGVGSTQMAAILNNADLSDVLKGTTHIHLIVLKVPGASPFAPTLSTKPSKHPVAPVVPPATPDQTAFYETAFGAEGGHRIIYTNIDPLHLSMVSFGHTRGYAIMVQVPGTIAVMRADGYPDLSKLSALVTQVSAVAAKAALDSVNTHKKTTNDN